MKFAREHQNTFGSIPASHPLLALHMLAKDLMRSWVASHWDNDSAALGTLHSGVAPL